MVSPLNGVLYNARTIKWCFILNGFIYILERLGLRACHPDSGESGSLWSDLNPACMRVEILTDAKTWKRHRRNMTNFGKFLIWQIHEKIKTKMRWNVSAPKAHSALSFGGTLDAAAPEVACRYLRPPLSLTALPALRICSSVQYSMTQKIATIRF